VREGFALLVSSCLLLISCGGANPNAGTKTANLAGNWQMTLQRQSTTSMKTESGFLVQSGNSLTGEFLLNGATNCAGVGSAIGQISGSNVAISVSQVGQTVNLTGAMGTTPSSIKRQLLHSGGALRQQPGRHMDCNPGATVFGKFSGHVYFNAFKRPGVRILWHRHPGREYGNQQREPDGQRDVDERSVFHHSQPAGIHQRNLNCFEPALGGRHEIGPDPRNNQRGREHDQCNL